MPEKDRLDLLIDSAIATCAEPPTGLEDRVLRACANARFASPARPHSIPVRRLLPWLAALGAAAAVLLALWINSHQASRPTQARTSVPSNALPAAAPPVKTTHHQFRASRPTQSQARPQPALTAAQTSPAPKLDVFPTPEPLTPQERVLVTFTARTPEPKLQALIAAQQQSNDPLSIPALQIQPLEPPNQGNK